MKTKVKSLLTRQKGIVAMLCMVCMLFGWACQSNTESNGDEQGMSKTDGDNATWVCKPEPNVVITLTYNSDRVYVNTSPKSLGGSHLESGKTYLFYNDDQYIVRGDTLFWVEPYLSPHVTNYGFIQTTLSSNTMRLQSFGLCFVDVYAYVKDYLFERKDN